MRGKPYRVTWETPLCPEPLPQLSCLTVLVVQAISSLSEGSGNASWGVGEAHSIGEGGDSTTLPKRRSLTCVRDCSEFINESILPQGSRRLCFV